MAATACFACCCHCCNSVALSTTSSAPPCAAGGPYVARWFNWLLNVSPNEALPLGHTLKNPAFGGSTSGARQAGAAQQAGRFARPFAAACSAAHLTRCTLNALCVVDVSNPTGAGIFTICVNDMVQEDVDLVIVEASRFILAFGGLRRARLAGLWPCCWCGAGMDLQQGSAARTVNPPSPHRPAVRLQFSLNDDPGSTGKFRENQLRLGMERLFRKLLDFPNR